jgi:hypothetical protein
MTFSAVTLENCSAVICVYFSLVPSWSAFTAVPMRRPIFAASVRKESAG